MELARIKSKKKPLSKDSGSKSLGDLNYILAVVSAAGAAVVSTAVESVAAESAVIVESETVVESVASVALLELQATTDKEIANAKNPNFNKFFMLISSFIL